MKNNRNTIITYHRLTRSKPTEKYTVAECEFEKHLTFLKENQYSCPVVESIFKVNGDTLKKNRVIITFDDGNSSDIDIALPLLKKYGFSATMFVTTDWLNKPGYLSKIQIRRLAEEGMSIQPHGKSHRYLNELNDRELRTELQESIECIENNLGNRVTCMSLPGGRYSKEVLNKIREMKLKAVFSSSPFHWKEYSDDFFIMGRCMVKNAHNKYNFGEMVNAQIRYRIKSRAEYAGKHLIKKLAGNKLYYNIWKSYNISKK